MLASMSAQAEELSGRPIIQPDREITESVL
jgi:hypothetical protein